MSAVWIASFAGECSECGGRINPGQECRFTEVAASTVQHNLCPDGPDEVADRAALAAGRCPRCTMHHPGQC
jgi:hypothetical protein